MFSTFNHLSYKISGMIAVVATEQKFPSPVHSHIISRDISDLCHRSGHSFKEGLLPSSHRMLPGEGRARRTLRSPSGPGCFVSELDHLCLYQAHRPRALLLPLPFFFFRGGLGVGGKPTRGELVRSTHRVLSPFISTCDFSLKPFL